MKKKIFIYILHDIPAHRANPIFFLLYVFGACFFCRSKFSFLFSSRKRAPRKFCTNGRESNARNGAKKVGKKMAIYAKKKKEHFHDPFFLSLL
jgi:hypothetical protein